MKILVTGAAGFIGSQLSEALSAEGHGLLGVDNFNAYYDRPTKERNAASVRAAGGTVLELDLAEDALEEAVHGAAAVFHLAAQPGLSSRTSESDYLRNNVRATERLLEACRGSSSLEMLFYISTSSVYGSLATGTEEDDPEPASIYGRTKLAAERLVLSAQASGDLEACSFRIFSVYGPRERPEKLFPLLIRSILRREAFPLFEGSLEHERSFTYVGDIVRGLVTALDRRAGLGGEIINLGSERSVTTAHAIRIVEDIMGQAAELEVVPRRDGDQLRTAAQIQKARRLLGYAPDTELRSGLEAEVRWFAGLERAAL